MTTQLRILHCVPSLDAADGGPARSVPALADAQSQAGAEVRVWTGRAPTIDLCTFQSARFETGDIKKVVWQGWTPDIIHDHGMWLPANHSVARLGRKRRIPRIVSPRGMLESWCLRHRRYRKLVAWRVYQNRDLLSSACLHATSECEAAQFRSLGFSQPIVLLPNGVTLPETVSVKELYQSSGENSKKEMLFLSRLHPVKGLKNLIYAWKCAGRTDWRLRIIGSDEDNHRAEIQHLINNQQLQSNVMLCDAVHTKEKWALLRDADVVVLPSFSENFGIVVAESLAAGTPVITTSGTPWKRIVEKRCGWYVEPTVAGLAHALNSAMNTDVSELKAMGHRGHEWVTCEFAWQKIAQKMLMAYEFVLGRRGLCPWFDHDSSNRRAA